MMTTADASHRLGLLGRKVGMMRIFTDDGDAVPVTVLDVSNNRVTQVKTVESDGYTALQVTYGQRKASRVNKPEAGHLSKAGVEAGEMLREFRVPVDVANQYSPGALVPVTLFAAGQTVDVQGTSIGKGFAGTIKRHNFGSQRASHGNSRSHNVPGSISMAQDPGRVFPGKKMTGHMGDVTVTTQNLDVVRVDEVRQLLLVKGAVPGSKNGHVVVRPAVKARKGAQ
jgi:large subunit ribosomal protein L3